MPAEIVSVRAALPPDHIGRKLWEARRRAGLYIHQVARRTGISACYLAQLERGVRGNPTLDKLRKLAEVFPGLLV